MATLDPKVIDASLVHNRFRVVSGYGLEELVRDLIDMNQTLTDRIKQLETMALEHNSRLAAGGL